MWFTLCLPDAQSLQTEAEMKEFGSRKVIFSLIGIHEGTEGEALARPDGTRPPTGNANTIRSYGL